MSNKIVCVELLSDTTNSIQHYLLYTRANTHTHTHTHTHIYIG